MGSGNSRPFRPLRTNFSPSKAERSKSTQPSGTKETFTYQSLNQPSYPEKATETHEFDDPFQSNNNEAQPLLTYAEAASLRAADTENMWAIVQKTCSQNDHAWVLNSVKNRRGWKTIRLFVSSTFKDFHSEREVLVKEVFPDLRLWCEERKLHLVECDLRWGVPKDSTTEETVRICLEEIDRCYRDNTMPYFLNLTCERSGWIPDFGDLTYNLAVLYGWVYGLSLTEMEIVHGAFRKCNPNALFMIRDSKFCDTLPGEIKEAFVDNTNNGKVDKLKEMLKQKFPPKNIAHYKVECDPCCLSTVERTKDEKEVKLNGLSGSDSVFYNTVFNFFKDRITFQYPLDPTPEDPLEAQKSAHESFLDTRSQIVLGRDKIINEIEMYIEDIYSDSSRAPLLLVGNAGSGKSAIMARIASNTLMKAASNKLRCPDPSFGWKVFFHFVGATPGSTDLAFFLQRLTRDLAPSMKDVVSDLDSLIQMTNSLLSNPNTKPAVIILDAVNQLDQDKIHYLTRWLPEVLSPNIRVVLSMIDHTDCHRLLRAYKSSPKEILCGELDYKSREAIVENILKMYNKRLDEHQMKLFLEKEGSANPLWLTLACEELRVYGHFNKMDEKITSLEDDLISLEEQLLMRFEIENGGPVVIATMCLLETSRHGLLETELLQMLADESNLSPQVYSENADQLTATKATDLNSAPIEDDALASKLQKEVDETYVQKNKDDKDDKVKKPTNKRKTKKFLSAAKWALVYRALKPLLRPCGDLGEGRLDFYHRSISKAVRRRYFSGVEGYVKHQYAFWHGRHAEFFEQCDDYDRKSEELPYHLEQLLDHNRLTRCLLDWEIFNRLYSDDFSIDLLSSWQKAGGYAAASLLYKESLEVMKKGSTPLEDYGQKMEKVINFLIQAGQYKDSYTLLEELLELEKSKLGTRTDRLAEIYQLMAKTKSEVVKNHNFVTMAQLEEDKETVSLAKKSLSYRDQLEGEEHEFKKALIGILLTHHLGIVADLEPTKEKKHRAECFDVIDKSIAIFQKLNDYGHLAEAIMTKSFINPRHSKYFKEKEQMLKHSFELCTKAYGEKHMLVLRLYLNIGILYEDNRDFQKAYDYFVMWNKVSTEVLGPAHPKTKRSKDTLEEATYVRIREQRERQAAGTA